MQKNILTLGLLTGALSIGLLFPKTSSAFWPFDKWFARGEVKGISTLFKKTEMVASPSARIVSEEQEEALEKSLSEENLLRAVKGKKISEANKKIILAKLAEIKTKREELRKLQEAFMAWMKANKIDPKSLDITATKSAEPNRRTTPAYRIPTTTNQ